MYKYPAWHFCTLLSKFLDPPLACIDSIVTIHFSNKPPCSSSIWARPACSSMYISSSSVCVCVWICMWVQVCACVDSIVTIHFSIIIEQTSLGLVLLFQHVHFFLLCVCVCVCVCVCECMWVQVCACVDPSLLNKPLRAWSSCSSMYISSSSVCVCVCVCVNVCGFKCAHV